MKKIIELQKLYNTNKYYQLQNTDDVLKLHTLFLADKIDKQALEMPGLFSIDISNILFPEHSVFELLKSKGYTITPVIQ